MKHWFLDTNVLIDFLTDRQPFATAANDIFRLAYAGEVRLYAASLSFSTAFYLMRRSRLPLAPKRPGLPNWLSSNCSR